MNKKLALIAVLVSTFFFSAPYVSACINPTVYNEKGTPINPLGGTGLTINGTAYSEMQIDFPISVKNKDEQGMTVTLRPYSGLRDYIDDANVYLQPGETKQLNLRVWVGGQSYEGVVQVFYVCDDGGPQMFFPIINTYIIGQKLEPPPTSTCDSHGLDGCYAGMHRDYYCSNKQLTYSAKCTDYCCQMFGGRESICSSDKEVCYTFNTLPPGTEGNIAFICKDSKCNYGNERPVAFLLRLNGWNVTMNPQESWTENELAKYDIIACNDESRSCSIEFNSLVYNQHIDSRKPFLEISSGRSALAAYLFDYATNKKITTGKYSPFAFGNDYITDGYAGYVQVTKGAVDGKNKYVALSTSYLSSPVKDLADSGNEQSVMFKIKEAVGHGRYAFIGWLSQSTSLTSEGTTLLTRALKWLKGGDEAFGGTNDDTARKGDIAFICNKDDCGQDNEMNLIKYLRKEGYSVTGKAKEKWTAGDLSSYNLIVCSDSKSCEIAFGSALYSAYKNSGKSFLEIPYKGGMSAAEVFGYVHSKSYKASSFGIVSTGSDIIFSGFNGYMEIINDKSKIYGASPLSLNPALTVAKDTEGSISTMFVYDASGSRGRYAYVGWVPDLNILSENGEKLLSRTVDWLVCGNSCLPTFSSAFGDLTLDFDINSPLNVTYNTNRVYLNVTVSQRVKAILASTNNGRPSTVCRDCDSVYKRLSVREGSNKLNVTLIDYTGKTYERIVYFTVKTK